MPYLASIEPTIIGRSFHYLNTSEKLCANVLFANSLNQDHYHCLVKWWLLADLWTHFGNAMFKIANRDSQVNAKRCTRQAFPRQRETYQRHVSLSDEHLLLKLGRHHLAGVHLRDLHLHLRAQINIVSTGNFASYSGEIGQCKASVVNSTFDSYTSESAQI